MNKVLSCSYATICYMLCFHVLVVHGIAYVSYKHIWINYLYCIVHFFYLTQVPGYTEAWNGVEFKMNGYAHRHSNSVVFVFASLV